ncbi:polymer-forming cytoskeletal protein [Acidobacteriota bacterium]
MLKKTRLKDEYPQSGGGGQAPDEGQSSDSGTAHYRRVVDRASDDDSRIASGSVLKGEITGKEGIRIFGRLEGNPSSDGLVRVYEQGSVHGNIHAPYVVLEGELKGNIIAAKHVELRSPAQMSGRIETELLAVAEGCVLEGKVDMLKKDAQPIHFEEKRHLLPAGSEQDQDS